MDKPFSKISDEEMAALVEALDGMSEEDCLDFYVGLQQCAWIVLCENPGCGFDEWAQTLMAQYPGELVDALGTDPEVAVVSLRGMWETGMFEDPETGECHVFKEWSEFLSSE